jgi:hypothetical protein
VRRSDPIDEKRDLNERQRTAPDDFFLTRYELSKRCVYAGSS